MIQFANQEDMDSHRAAQKARIYDTYAESNGRYATPISKADLDAQYPKEQFEIYSLQSLHKFRTDLMKAEDVADKDEAFKEATKDMVSLIVHENGKKVPCFVRKKEAGE